MKWRVQPSITGTGPNWRAHCGRCELSVYRSPHEQHRDAPWFALTFIRYSADHGTFTRHRSVELAKKAASGRCGCGR